jgi:DNA-binding CsgD family transcriptional regulator
MRHLIIAFYLLALMAGTASLSQTFMIWQRHRKPVIKRYGFFLLSLYLIVLGFLVDLYTRITSLSETLEARALSWILLAGGGILYIFICPYFFHSLAGLSVTRTGRVVFSVIDFFVCIGAAANIAVPSSAPIAIALIIILFAMIAFGIIFIAVHLRGIGERTLRRALTIFLSLSAVFFPLMLIDAVMGYVPLLSLFKFMENMAQPLYFLLLNCLTIVFGVRYLNRPAFLEKDRLTPYFLSTFGVTEREREIIGLLLDGTGTKQIGEKLFISPKTAENHVYNIYQKLGVRNRVQMFQLIKTNALD